MERSVLDFPPVSLKRRDVCVCVCVTRVIHPSFNSSVSCQCYTPPPNSFVCLFTLWYVSSFTYRSHFLCTHSVFFPSLLCSHTPLHKHPAHTLVFPFIHSSVAADINHVCPLMVPLSACCHSTDHLLLHTITSLLCYKAEAL